MAEIASGDFSRHVDVPNRDELGALAANLNLMNDELGRLYEQLESPATELASWNRTLEARVDDQVKELRASRSRVVLAANANVGGSSAISTTVHSSTSSDWLSS